MARDIKTYFQLPSKRFSAIFAIFFVTAVFFLPGTIEGKENSPEPEILSASEVDYPPFCIVDNKGNAGGFSVELMSAALTAMNRKVTFQTGTWPDVRGWLERGEVQALPLVGRTPEREPLFDFTFPYMSIHGAIVVRQGQNAIADLEDLKGKQVAVMKGDNAEEFLRRKDRRIDIKTTSTFEEALLDLSQGHYDAVVIQRLVAIRLIAKNRITNLHVLEKPIEGFQQDFCFAVKEGDREMLALLNEGLALVMADGTYRHLHAKWFAALQLPAKRDIIVGGDSNYPPYEYLDENGRPVGYNVDITRAIARAMGMDIEIRLGPWEKIREELSRGEIDVIQRMSYSTERDRKFDFTQTHTLNHYVGVVRNGEGAAPAKIDELANKRILVQRGDIIHDLLLEKGLGKEVTALESEEEALRELALGKYDCALVPRITALYWIKKHGWTNLALGQRALLSPEYCYAVLKGQKAILTQFSEGLSILEESGEYRRIYEKWMGRYPKPLDIVNVLRYFSMVLFPLILILVAIFLWSWSLRRKVSAKTRELSESIDKFQYVFESANVGKSITLLTGQMNANNTLADFLGYSKEELNNKTWKEITPEEDIEATQNKINTLLSGEKESVRFEKRYLHKGGAHLWADASVIIRRDDSGKPLYLITTIVDINEKKRAEEALRESEELFRKLFEEHAAAKLIIDPDTGKIIDANKAASAFYGWSREVLRTMKIQDINTLSPEEVEKEMQKVRREKRVHFEFSHRKKDGTIRAVEVFSSKIEVKGKEYLHSVIHDITDRKKAETALLEAEERYRILFENSPDGIVVIDPKTSQFIEFNEIACRQLGYSHDEFARLNLSDLELSERPEETRAHIEKVINNGRNDFETKHLTKKGDTRDIHVTAQSTNILGKDFYHCVWRDITSQKKTEEKLNNSLERLRKAIATTVQVMVSAVEIRDPYTAGHQNRTADLARAIAMEMGLPEGNIDGIRLAGSIHDIGKLSVPAEILSKPAKLTDIEFSLIKEHPRHGYEILKDVETEWPLAEIVYQHHERMDGSGYPRGLKGDEIIMDARIMAVADVVEAIASHRPYRPALGIDFALKEISEKSGELYDPQVVIACLDLFREKGYKFPK